MRLIFTKLFFIILITGILISGSLQCLAQAVGDTTRTGIAADTAAQKKKVIATAAIAQPAVDTADDDSVAIIKKTGPWQPNPKKAGLYSAIFPGLGQLYNKQYWKVPIVYVGIGVAGYFIVSNLTKYQSYREAYINRINNPNYTDQYTNVYQEPQLQQLQSDYSKYLDLTVLFTGIGFMVQVVDAITSAHLKNFDISRDISMRIKPIATPEGVGLGLVMNLK